eukprot:598002-Lingulodinium_polyedra.AAC.1
MTQSSRYFAAAAARDSHVSHSMRGMVFGPRVERASELFVSRCDAKRRLDRVVAQCARNVAQ